MDTNESHHNEKEDDAIDEYAYVTDKNLMVTRLIHCIILLTILMKHCLTSLMDEFSLTDQKNR